MASTGRRDATTTLRDDNRWRATRCMPRVHRMRAFSMRRRARDGAGASSERVPIRMTIPCRCTHAARYSAWFHAAASRLHELRGIAHHHVVHGEEFHFKQDRSLHEAAHKVVVGCLDDCAVAVDCAHRRHKVCKPVVGAVSVRLQACYRPMRISSNCGRSGTARPRAASARRSVPTLVPARTRTVDSEIDTIPDQLVERRIAPLGARVRCNQSDHASPKTRPPHATARRTSASVRGAVTGNRPMRSISIGDGA